MLRYFREGLRPSIRVELEHRDLELESFEQLIKKVVEAEGKASLRPRTTTREMDQHCSRGSRPTNTTVAKASTPSSSIKDPRVEKLKVWTQKATSSYHHKSIETSNRKTRKERKKQRRLEHKRAQNDSSSAPTTKVNIPNVSSTTRKDLSYIICFNCDQKGHYATQCPEPKKDASED